MQQRRAPAVPEGPEGPGKRDVQRELLGCMAPLVYAARLFGMAPFRLVPPTAQREAAVQPCPFWAAYSTAAVMLTAATMAWVDYRLIIDPVLSTTNSWSHLGFAGLGSVLKGSFVLKQSVALFLTAYAVCKGGDVARVVEKLVRISTRLPVGVRWTWRARWVVVAQVSFLVCCLVFMIAVALLLKNMVFVGDAIVIPGLYLINVQFTDAALLLCRELEAMNERLEVQFEPQQAWASLASMASPIFLTAKGGDVGALSWMPRTKSGGGRRQIVIATRAAQRELRRTFLQLDATFALQNLAFIMIAFVQITVVLYMTLVEGLYHWVSAVATVMLLAQLLHTLTACQATTEASRSTAVVVHKALLRGDLSEATRAELVDLSVQLLSAEMRFSAWGFFAMDYQLLQSFVGTVVTYIVIMVQFRSPSKAAAANVTAVEDAVEATAAPLLSTASN